MCFVFWAFTPSLLPKIQNGKILFAIINNETATRENIKNDKKFTSYNSRYAVTLLVPRRSTHICYANIAYRLFGKIRSLALAVSGSKNMELLIK